MKCYPFQEMLRIWRVFSGRGESEFWEMTPAQYYNWLAPYLRAQSQHMPKAALETLMKTYPDLTKKQEPK